MDVTFQLEAHDAAALTKRMQKLWIGRNSSRPDAEPRIAMPFVDPDGMPAKELIQSVGLAGIREGDVSLDARHPNYLVAHTGATSDQCLRLIERVRDSLTVAHMHGCDCTYVHDGLDFVLIGVGDVSMST